MTAPVPVRQPGDPCGCGCSTRGYYVDRCGDDGAVYAEIRDVLARCCRLLAKRAGATRD